MRNAPTRHLTTPRHFAIFRAEVLRLVKLWNVTGWDVSITHELLDHRRAECWYSLTSRLARISLSTECGPAKANTPSDEQMIVHARHEVAHLLLAEMSAIAGSRYTTEDEEKTAEEALVNRLMELLPR